MLSFVDTIRIYLGKKMDTFTVRDLRERTGELIKDAEEGHLSLVTKHGQPVFIAVPFKDELINWGIHVALAMHLYEENVLSLSKAAKLAQESIESFIEKLGMFNIPVVNYAVEDIEKELAFFKKEQNSGESLNDNKEY